MAITLDELRVNPERLGELQLGLQHCARCQVMLQETLTGKRPAPGGQMCSDCYYEAMGEGVESDPIATPGLRRG